ncbi:gustatory receptor for sugar taste 64e-like [Helicoverpa zea]|uniref:gustatory receptor for sugar taste 64e-like n=1 Tax=Helicoverpa zea TaxID=7113 RepID=UPI001F592F91|nr:gustatory receptor for sugar taste 64e-like [Helicoverpa zea]
MTSKLFLKTFNMATRHRLDKREICGLHSTVRGTLFCSRVMGLLPVSGLTCPTSRRLRFTFRSPYTVLYVASLFGQLLMFVMTFCWLMMNGISLANITNAVFYTSSLISSLILLHIGRCWPALVGSVETLERELPPFHRNVASISNITTIFILTAAIVEHLLSVFYGLKVACACDSNNVAENYFRFNMPWIFDYTPFTIWKGALSELFNIQSTFVWSLNDLLIMVTSIYLTEHLLIHNELLKKAAEQGASTYSECADHARFASYPRANHGNGFVRARCRRTLKKIRTDWLDGKHVVFGHVISGLDVVKKMEKYGSKSGTVSSKVTISNCGELQ